ncbi:hypothetical protein Glove_57g84 [Diversispora epigaea]|uniref:Protein kinase domain-containing protein n=1 Tax=Diversispora epigaea TaxID=1348612 RepID=A0A397JD95_9GLOM|nr:hypothetical protein Glove_57g84 [Diversispora epigaea]
MKTIYCNGNEISKDRKKVFQWYLKSAEGGNGNGQFIIGYSYVNGIGTTKGEKKTFQWYLKSAEGGNSKGQLNLGYCYVNEIGTTKVRIMDEIDLVHEIFNVGDLNQWENNKNLSDLKGQFITKFDYCIFKNITRIANGGFATVYRANSTILGKRVVLKSFHDNGEFYEKFVRELTNIIAVNKYDNIINFYEISIDPSTEKYYLVLQYAKGGDLRSYLRNNFTSLDWKTKIDMAKDLARGLQFIHQANIVHRDLNSKNILVHEGRLLISDFVLSKSLDSDSNSFVGGMFAYTDPEYFKDGRYKRNKSSDIYSLGVLFWEISSGRPPFDYMHNLNIFHTIKSGGREILIQGTPLDYFKIYSCAWDQNPTQRPTIEDICNSLENIDISLENIYNSPEFETNFVSFNSTNSGIIAIEYHGEASTFHNFNNNEWFDDIIIKNNEIIKYDYEVFRSLKYIGKGGFGSVHSATLIDEKMTKTKVALKSIVVRVHDIKLFVNELRQHLKVCSHENIIGFYGVSQKGLNSNEYILVLEYANGGTLRSYLESNFKNLKWSDKLNLAQQIAKAIKHLHSHDVIHRDLHSNNILIHNNIIKISDFGLAISDPSSTLLKLAGSITYSDPMLLINGDKFNRTKASDIYSFGILLWEISSGEIPYKKYRGPSKILHIIKGNRETPVIGSPQDYINIYQDCWKQDQIVIQTLIKLCKILNMSIDIFD